MGHIGSSASLCCKMGVLRRASKQALTLLGSFEGLKVGLDWGKLAEMQEAAWVPPATHHIGTRPRSDLPGPLWEAKPKGDAFGRGYRGVLMGLRSPEHRGLLCLFALREGQARLRRGLAAKGRK